LSFHLSVLLSFCLPLKYVEVLLIADSVFEGNVETEVFALAGPDALEEKSGTLG
jgi:hypothetical protein